MTSDVILNHRRRCARTRGTLSPSPNVLPRKAAQPWKYPAHSLLVIASRQRVRQAAARAGLP